MHHLFHLSVVIDMGVDILEEFSLGMLEMEVQISGGNDQLHIGYFHNSISVHKLHIENHIVDFHLSIPYANQASVNKSVRWSTSSMLMFLPLPVY